MVTFADLREARVEPLATAADAWERFAGRSRAIERQVADDLAGPLRGAGWQGEAADAALSRMTSLHDEFEVYAVKARNLATMLNQAAREFGRLQLTLQAAVDAATGLGLRVTADGQVVADEVPLSALSDPGALDAQRLAVRNAGIYADLIAAILAEAGHVDLDFRDVLREMAPGRSGPGEFSWAEATDSARDAAALAGLSAAAIPSPGTNPARAAEWWRGLTADQRDLLLTAYPAELGRLDGLPAADRDRANRMTLHELIGADLNASRDPADPQHQRLVNLLDRLNAADYQRDRPLYLLGLDNHGTGQAVVAVGNPDTARHTAILVPGVSTDLDGIRGQINRAGRLQDSAAALGGGDVAVIAWLGYEPPQLDETVVTAAGSHRAEAGAVSLDRFADGLRVSHDAGPSHLTAVGHSYGSVVVGEAASGQHHLAVDDIVTVGSPGMDVHRAADLDVGARHVWAGAATDDPVASPGTAIPYVGPDVEILTAIGHDTKPHQPAFGGNVYTVDTSGHTAYWTPGSESLANQASVIAGQYGQVTLDHGKTPS